MTVYGYWRCSTDLQDQERQVLALDQAGCEKIYGDKITGTSNYGDREELSKCIEQLQQDDLLVLEDMTRLGRTMVTMLVEVNNLIERGVFIKTPLSIKLFRLIVGVMGYAAECELRNIKHRTSEGRAVAKTRGVKFGAKRKFDKYQVSEILEKRKQGQGYGTIAKSLGMNRSTVQKIVEREGVAA